jgi:hypothetical protein
MSKEKYWALERDYALVQARAKSVQETLDSQEETESEYLKKEFYRLKACFVCILSAFSV